MSDKLDIHQWARSRVESMSNEIKSAIDCGQDMEAAVDQAFENSVLGYQYKMQVLANVANYRHSHKWVVDIITKREWCASCQQFK